MAGSLITYWAMSRPFYSTPMDRYSDIRERRQSYRRTLEYQAQKTKTQAFSRDFQKNTAPKPRKSFSGGGWLSKEVSFLVFLDLGGHVQAVADLLEVLVEGVVVADKFFMKYKKDYFSLVDPELKALVGLEERRQFSKIRLIASENYASQAVLQALSCVLSNKYSEGYPKKRYYHGQQYVDQVEQLAIDRAKDLFGAEYANVQSLSGAVANIAAYSAFLKPGETLMALSLPHGGHLSHGWPVHCTGQIYKTVFYTLDPKNVSLRL